MDFDYSTILYVILGIVYFVFSGVSKNKKKAQESARKKGQPGPETVGPPPVNRRPTFEELLEEFTGQKTIEPEPEIIPEVVAPVEISEVANKYPTTITSSETKQEEASLVSFAAYDDTEEEETVDYAEMFSDLDGAKRAFVASEVFQRKY